MLYTQHTFPQCVYSKSVNQIKYTFSVRITEKTYFCAREMRNILQYCETLPRKSSLSWKKFCRRISGKVINLDCSKIFKSIVWLSDKVCMKQHLNKQIANIYLMLLMIFCHAAYKKLWFLNTFLCYAHIFTFNMFFVLV